MPATADPDLALRLAKETAEVYGQATDDMLRIVAKRLARGIDSPGWAERKLIEQADLRNEARAVVDRLEVDGPAAAERAIRSGWDVGMKIGADEMGIAQGFGRTHTRAVDALVRETVTKLQSTHGQILRATVDGYRAVIAESSTPRVLTGTMTRRQASQQALNRFAREGIRGFRDKAGRNWQLETYAEMSTRTSVGRAQVAGTLDRFVANGRDLVIVSDAPQECSLCRPYEGRVFSISGASQRYPALDSASGLFHANCRHAVGAYIEGLTQPLKHTADPKGDALRQQQRALERRVREAKRVAGVQLPDGHRLTPMQQAANVRVREAQAALKRHVDDNGLKRLRYREQITAAI